ncbi:hypothetical protein Q0Z83_085930 [Actinoplanes sichuanensis]|uniref:Uncharacterized protein n=1 Tax=Actinoplanes sichuanensis TaxID=512349 RepID=A0ABW4AKY8_9ACTN|nr:hypothetical protein [Actinoplanes sichuanensis]BEL10402.1 hypothetical protein Q0Z83_085930 [Actinoplanes sichuanensis]
MDESPQAESLPEPSAETSPEQSVESSSEADPEPDPGLVAEAPPGLVTEVPPGFVADASPAPRRPSALIAGLAVLALAAGAGAVIFWPDRPEPATATPVPSASVTPSASATPPTPLEQVNALIDAQAQALVKGDEAGWLAPVDPKLQGRYRTIFQNLRALEVTAADLTIDGEPKMAGTTMKVRVDLNYCFSGVDCPAHRSDPGAGAPAMINTLTWTPRNGSYTITAMAGAGVQNYLQPAPWENAALTVAQGRRVIVAGPKSQAENVRRTLPLAEKAAAVADRYGTRLHNEQKKYRIYLADDKGWKNWYSGMAPNWSVAYHLPLNGIGSDIVVKAGEAMSGSNREVTEIIQHEMGHAVTLNDNRNWDDEDDLWLIEGVAEYIGYQPSKPQNSYSRDALRYIQARRGAVKTIALPPLTDESDDLTVARLYATGHFGVGCIAEKFGEDKMFNFVSLVLREGLELDVAAQVALDKPFKTVDKACVSWIKQKL